jgi:hypothetical protein
MEPAMTRWFGAIVLAGAIMLGAATASFAAEASKAPAPRMDASARHHNRFGVYDGRRYAYRPYYPYYYGHPYYYSPGPFFPFVPFVHGWDDPWLW